MPSSTLAKIGLSPRLLEPGHLISFILASSSIGSLLLYFSGTLSMPRATRFLLVPSALLLAGLALWASRTGRSDLVRRPAVGVWAGSFATLLYDIVRVPLVHAGLPVFKAISYFGTIIVSVPQPTVLSEIVGWSYHFSNGVGFTLMYVLLVSRPRWWSAVLWGITLEGAMLVTPYAEVFGYRMSPRFIAITVGAHVFFGLGMWAGARYLWERWRPGRGAGTGPRAAVLLIAWIAGPVGLTVIAADFHRLHARTIPSSPPPYIGPDLYVTWSTPEPDRIGAIWLMKRFVEPGARFHFIEPMSRADFGTLFDLPEAEIRRYQNRSTFDVVLEERAGSPDDPALELLARFCYVTEIRPWALPSDPEVLTLAESLSERLGGCKDMRICLEDGLQWFDETYERLSGER